MNKILLSPFSTIYLKPTNYCDVGCKHCFISYMDRKEFKFMTENEMRIVREKLDEYHIGILEKSGLKDKNIFGVMITFHGGEPLSIELEKFKKYIEIFKEENENSKYVKYDFTMQTSLQPLFDLNGKEKEKWYQFLEEYFKGGIGVSYDFFGIRKYKGSEKKYEKNFLRISRELNERGIKLYLNTVVTKRYINNEEVVWEWILKNNKYFEEIQFERYNEYGLPNHLKTISMTNRNFSDIMSKIMTKHFYNDDPNIKIRIFFNLYNSILKWQAGDIWSGDCMSSAFVINPDGSTNNCVDKADEESFGNIFEEEIEKILLNSARRKWIKYQKVGHRNEECSSCIYEKICNTGCPLIDNKKVNKDDECSGYKTLFKTAQILVENNPESNIIKHIMNSDEKIKER